MKPGDYVYYVSPYEDYRAGPYQIDSLSGKTATINHIKEGGQGIAHIENLRRADRDDLRESDLLSHSDICVGDIVRESNRLVSPVYFVGKEEDGHFFIYCENGGAKKVAPDKIRHIKSYEMDYAACNVCGEYTSMFDSVCNCCQQGRVVV